MSILKKANRTLQEEFIDNEIEEFNDRLMYYLAYNTIKVHQSLNNVSPIDYLSKILPGESHMDVSCTIN